MADLSLEQLQKFMRVFCGNTACIGQYVPSAPGEEGTKQKGKAYTKQGAISAVEYRMHIMGQVGLGICPVTSDGQASFTVIDVDVYDKSADHLLERIRKYELPLVPFRSKSGGLHLYTFYSAFVDAKQAIDYANLMRIVLGLPGETEIFPKQTRIKAGGSGNWINLPYFGGDGSSRALIKEDGTLEPSTVAAIDYCESRRVTIEQMIEWAQSLDLIDAPPCLQTLYYMSNVQDRNNYLFSLAVYLKQKFGADELQERLLAANLRMANPLPEDEIINTIVKSHLKGEYGYKCKDVPCRLYCNKQLCSTRQYHYTDLTSTLHFERLIMYSSDPPFYDWVINGVALRFDGEADLLNQDRFIEMCMRKLSVVPMKQKRERWTEILNSALKNKEVVEMTNSVASDAEMARECLRKFLIAAKFQGTLGAALKAGRPYLSWKQMCVFVETQALMGKLQSEHFSKSLEVKHVVAWLQGLGAQSTIRKCEGHSVRVWQIPVDSLFNGPEEYEQWKNTMFTFNTGSETATTQQIEHNVASAFDEAMPDPSLEEDF